MADEGNADAGPRLCFVLSPIGAPGTETRTEADTVLKEIIRPAVEELHGVRYEVRRADEETEPGIITDHVIRDVLEADLVVADLSDWNANVMYELAIRHAKGAPTVQIIHPDAALGYLPFDIAGSRTIEFNRRTLSGRSQTVSALKAAAESAVAAGFTESPVSRAINFLALVRGGTDAQAAILEAIDSLRAEVRAVSAPPRRGTVGMPLKDWPISRIAMNMIAETLSGVIGHQLRGTGADLRLFSVHDVDGWVARIRVVFQDRTEKGFEIRWADAGYLVPAPGAFVDSVVMHARMHAAGTEAATGSPEAPGEA
jgi:hypothetical protein